MSHTTLSDTDFNQTHRCPRGVDVSGPCNSISTIQYRETGDPVVDRILTLDEYRVDEGWLRQVDLYVLVSVHGGGHPASSQTPQVGCGSDTDNALTIKWPLLKNFLIILFFLQDVQCLQHACTGFHSKLYGSLQTLNLKVENSLVFETNFLFLTLWTEMDHLQ